MTETPSPSAALAERVAKKLIESGLLRAEKSTVFVSKIASGKISGADWKIEIDLASAKAGQP